jgi:GTP-binding protein
MNIKTAEYISSTANYKNCPESDRAEFAFIGRSNVGKSSLINMLTGRTKLAKTSARPGKTQVINHFDINGGWYLVDLPGYGWARISKEMREKWGKMIRDYLRNRSNLVCTFILIDARLEPQPIDLDLIQWMGENQLPFCLVFTKADKESRNHVMAMVGKFKRELHKTWENLPTIFITSAEKRVGRDDLLAYIDELVRAYSK